MPRFVILRHERTVGWVERSEPCQCSPVGLAAIEPPYNDSPEGVHFDFMLEAGEVLKTWSLPQPPEIGVEMPCDSLPDHRLLYLDYEGPISGDRGSVSRWDFGTYTVERQTESEWAVTLSGQKLQGKATIRLEVKDSNRWAFSFQDLEFSGIANDSGH